MRDPSPSVFSIAPGAPFLDTLAKTVVSGILGHGGVTPSPLELAETEILLPSRRAARSLGSILPHHVPGGALMLPRISTLGDVDEDTALRFSADAPAPPNVVSDLERQIVLADIARQWATTRTSDGASGASSFDLDPVPRSAGEAAAFAHELGRLFDAMEVEDIGGSGFADVLPEDLTHLARNWEINLNFLNHALEQWIHHLKWRGLVSRIAHRSTETDRLTAKLETQGSQRPIIAAGSTGSVPATARLMRAIAGLPNGAVVLPGLDFHLDATSWGALGPDHPQYGMKVLLENFGIERADVRQIGSVPTAQMARAHIQSEALRPAETTQKWIGRLKDLRGPVAASGFDGVSLIHAANENEEARVVALIMRRALEEQTGTLALVTPDRSLARRVRSELSRWQIVVDDSAGQSLGDTPQGVFLSLLAETVISGFSPTPTLGLLKHPLTRLGLTAAEIRKAARVLELLVIRGARTGAGLDGLAQALEGERGARRRHPVLARINSVEIDGASALLARLALATQALDDAMATAGCAPAAGQMVQALLECAEAMAAVPDSETAVLWRGPAGELLASFLAELADICTVAKPIEPFGFAGWLSQLMAGQVVRQNVASEPRLAIWGLLEARLQHADCVILAGLNEGTWPTEAETDPWLGRHMRAALGLAPPERRTGLQAHDFSEAILAPRVFLTRSDKSGGTPTVPSRWLWRLDALARGLDMEEHLAPEAPWLAWARGLDPAPPPEPVLPPMPTPPVAARPMSLPVTAIETWIRDPYAIYARHILKLQPLDASDQPPDARNYGSMIHEALAKLLLAFPASPLPNDAYSVLLKLADEAFTQLRHRPGLHAYWWTKVERIARWFVDEDAALRDPGTRSITEVKGRFDIAVPGLEVPFRLTARADRIDLMPGGQSHLLDYKTGSLPSPKEVASMLAPQMPLEAAILRAGGFESTGRAEPTRLTYVQLSGRKPAGAVAHLPGDTVEVAAAAIEKLTGLVAKYAQIQTPYRSRVAPKWDQFEGDYDHLARVKEWSLRNGERHGG